MIRLILGSSCAQRPVVSLANLIPVTFLDKRQTVKRPALEFFLAEKPVSPAVVDNDSGAADEVATVFGKNRTIIFEVLKEAADKSTMVGS